MTNQDNPHGAHDGPTIEHEPQAAPRRGRSVAFVVGIGLASVIAIGAGVAVAQGGWGHGGWGKAGHMGMRFAEHRFERVMDEIDATDAQQDKIWAILDRTRAEMRPVGREFRNSRDEAMAIFAAPTIDRAAAEKLRSERIAAIDAASKKAVDAMIEAAEVLTPEQRAKLAEEIHKRHDRD